MKVWILGSGGLLGTAVNHLCQEQKIECVAALREEVDITSLDQLQKHAEAIEPSHIINCAAYTNVDGAEKEAGLSFAVNAIGPENIGIVARQNGIKVVHISTDYVFGSRTEVPFVETDPCCPIGMYAKSKWEGENRLLDELSSACIIRTSWLFGSKGRSFLSSLFGFLCTQPEVRAVADQRGRPTFCRDLAETVLALLCHSGIFHFANEGILTRYQMAQDMHEEAKKRGAFLACQTIVPVGSSDFPTLAERPMYSVLNTDKITTLLGKKPRSWSEVLNEYLTYVIP
jgi:dTDP-4-dehydrorhamnose reductase